MIQVQFPLYFLLFFEEYNNFGFLTSISSVWFLLKVVKKRENSSEKPRKVFYKFVRSTKLYYVLTDCLRTHKWETASKIEKSVLKYRLFPEKYLLLVLHKLLFSPSVKVRLRYLNVCFCANQKKIMLCNQLLKCLKTSIW